MTQEQLAAYILKWVSAIVVSLGGVGGILAIVKSAIKAKSTKMSAKDKNDIAELAAQKVITSQDKQIEVDLSAQVDKATNKRLKLVEDGNNTFVRLMNKLLKQQKHIITAIKDFKTISPESRSLLLADIDEVDETVDEIKPDVAVVSFDKKENVTAKESY